MSKNRCFLNKTDCWWETFSLIDWFYNTTYIASAQILISRVYTLSKWCAARGLIFHPLSSTFFNYIFVSFCDIVVKLRYAQTKYVTLKLNVFSGLLRWARNRIIALRKRQMSKFGTISQNTDCTVRQANNEHYPFSFLRSISFTIIWQQ